MEGLLILLGVLVTVEVLGLPTRYFPHADRPEEILGRVGLDVAGVVEAVHRFD